MAPYPETTGPVIVPKWKGINELMFFTRTQGVTEHVVKELQWNTDVHNSISRKLLNEAHGIFMEFQLLCEEGEPEKEQLVKTSMEYRAIIQSCIIKIRETIKNERHESTKQNMESELNLFSIMDLIWHLCEALIVESKSSSYCMSHLLNWIHVHFNEADILAQSVMSAEDPYSHDDFWTTVYSFVLQGRLEEVCGLLCHHPYREVGVFDAFASIEDLMTKMPVFQAYDGQSVNEFHFKWKQWHQECSRRLKEGDFNQYDELKTICEMLCGVDETISNHKHLVRSWYQVMVAKLLYSDPTIKIFNLKQHAVESMEIFNGIGKVTSLDEIFLSIMSFDIHKVIEKCSESLPNWWFVSHLTDLLYHGGLLKSTDFEYGAELREFLLLNFASSLMSHSSLWNTAADYLMTCPSSGRDHLAAFLEKIPLDNEKKALKVIHLCEKYGFSEQSNGICKVMGMKALRRKRLGVALSWCLRAKDEQFASYLTEHFLNHYMESGTFTQCDLIENLGSSMLLNNKLTFLGKYYEFHKLYTEEKFKEAGTLLVSLLTSNLAPKKFWMILFTDALPLLEYKEVIFSSDQTFELMQHLTELQLCNHVNITKTKVKNTKAMEEDEKDQIELLNLALSRNLGRSLLLQTSMAPIR